MLDRATLRNFEDLFYRCRFNALIESIRSYEAGDQNPGSSFYLLQAAVFFETNQVELARKALENAEFADDTNVDDQRYTLARLAYMCRDWKKARAKFYEIYEETDCPRMRFKSVLGIATTYFDQEQYDHVEYLLDELIDQTPQDRPEDQIALHQFLGNYLYKSEKNPKEARVHFGKAMNLAALRNWNYWVIRSLYGMAKVAKNESKSAELGWTLNVLKSFVEGSEARFLTNMINEEFSGLFEIETPVEFDRDNMRMMVNDRWVSFNESPKLFHFLELLHKEGNFVKKRNIAETLWPEECYKPGVHDPRIFDIAKRVRGVIEEQNFQPISLLSGRQGYKLAAV